MSCFEVKILDPNINTIEIEKCIGDQPASIDIVTYNNTSVLEVSHCIGLSSEIAGLLESVQDIIGNSGLLSGNYININYNDNTGFTTISATGLQPSGNYSIVGHNHISSDITNFNSSVSGLLPSVSGSNNVVSSFANNVYTISVSGLQPSGNYSAIGHTHTSSNITDFNSSVSGLLPVISNNGNNRLLTSTGTNTGINAENNLTFDGSNLEVNGSLSVDNLILNNNTISNKTNSQGYPGDSYPVTIDAGIMGVQISGSVVPTLVFNSNSPYPLGAIIGFDVGLENSIAYTSSNNIDTAHSLDISVATSPSGQINFYADELTFNGIPISISGHSHLSSDIINFNAAVSGLIPVKDIVAGNDISITSVSGIYTIDSVVTGVDEADSLITIVFNKTGSIIPKMSVVYINGGQGDMPTVTLAKADSEATSSKTYGITAENIDHMSSGKVIVEGSLGGLNTDQFNPSAPQGNVNGTVVYLSPTVSGGITTTKPSAPYHMVSVGTIVRTHQNEGVIEVRIQNGFELQELHNVAISGVSDGQFLQYNNASGLWLASSSGNFTSLKVNNIDASVSGHNHIASNITDFDTAVSGVVMSILNQFNLIGY